MHGLLASAEQGPTESDKDRHNSRPFAPPRPRSDTQMCCTALAARPHDSGVLSRLHGLLCTFNFDPSTFRDRLWIAGALRRFTAAPQPFPPLTPLAPMSRRASLIGSLLCCAPGDLEALGLRSSAALRQGTAAGALDEAGPGPCSERERASPAHPGRWFPGARDPRGSNVLHFASLSSRRGTPSLLRGAPRPRASASAASTAEASKSPSPFALVDAELRAIAERMRAVLLSEVPHLHAAATHFVADPSALGKLLRPSVVMLVSSALSEAGEPRDFLTTDVRPVTAPVPEPRRRQQRIAETTEMIHVATLMHDDVLDDALTRRGKQSVNAALGNKLAILGGDFLLARASVSLAGLRDPEVMEMLATVLEHLVTGEVMQMRADGDDLVDMQYYLRKTFYKTASLVAHACKAAAKLGGQGPDVQKLAFQFGKHLGLAFQVVDDVLDFTQSSGVLGKPALNDLRSGIATAPVLLALRQRPELEDLTRRKFREVGDVERAAELVRGSDGIPQARVLAADHARRAAQCVADFPVAQTVYAEQCRAALMDITQRVISREH